MHQAVTPASPSIKHMTSPPSPQFPPGKIFIAKSKQACERWGYLPFNYILKSKSLLSISPPNLWTWWNITGWHVSLPWFICLPTGQSSQGPNRCYGNPWGTGRDGNLRGTGIYTFMWYDLWKRSPQLWPDACDPKLRNWVSIMVLRISGRRTFRTLPAEWWNIPVCWKIS